MVSKVDSARIFADKIASYLDSKEKDFAYSLFSFKANHDVFRQAINKLLFDNNIKELINLSFGKARDIVSADNHDEKVNIEELYKQEETLLQCIDAFLGNEKIDLLMKKENSPQKYSLKRKLSETLPDPDPKQSIAENMGREPCKSQIM